MKKDYQAPEVELISLTAKENVTNDDDLIGGEMGEESSIF